MLTIKKLDAFVAKTYFEKGYYQQGRWYGNGASKLSLQGNIDSHEAFNNVLDGFSPDRSFRLTGKAIKLGKHQAGIDCTFNAPKSVSLQALIGGDDRLIEAHRRAVNRTLDIMESRYALTRILKKGQPRQVVTTNSLVVAQFDHIETRDLDPHLHTHCVVMNVTQAHDSKWRSLHNKGIFQQQKLLGMIYQHNLALEAQALGYEVIARKHGQFDLVGYSERDLEAFSKRRQAILAKVGEGATVGERNIAWRTTRKNKKLVSPEELKARWAIEAKELGIEFIKSEVDRSQKSEVRENTGQQAIGNMQSKSFVIPHCLFPIPHSPLPIPLTPNP